jgi:hypothetical protein
MGFLSDLVVEIKRATNPEYRRIHDAELAKYNGDRYLVKMDRARVFLSAQRSGCSLRRPPKNLDIPALLYTPIVFGSARR